MDRRKSGRVWNAGGGLPSPVLFAVLALGTASSAAIVMSHLPAHLVLPAVSLVAIGCAAVTASCAWLAGASRGGEAVTVWDVSGALALIGIAAGMLSEPDQALQLFGHDPMTR